MSGSGQLPADLPDRSALDAPTLSKGLDKKPKVKYHDSSMDDDRDEEIVRLYDEGKETLKKIGERFGVSKQRVWQIVSKYRIKRRKSGLENPRESEKWVANKLRSMGMSAEHNGYNGSYDILCKKKLRIEVKHCLHSHNNYAHFHNIRKYNFDFLIALIGKLGEHTSYIVPVSECYRCMSFPINPKSTTRKQRKYREKWWVLKGS